MKMRCILVVLSIPAFILAGSIDPATGSAEGVAAFLPRRHGSDMGTAKAHGKKKKKPIPPQSIAGLNPFTRKEESTSSAWSKSSMAKDGEKPRSPIHRYLWSRICLSYRESKMKETLYAIAIIMTTIIVMSASAAFVAEPCKLSDTGDLPSSLRCVFECVMEGLVVVLDFLVPAVPLIFLLDLILVLLLDAIYGTEYIDAKISFPEEKANKQNWFGRWRVKYFVSHRTQRPS